jgi:hypothetical protein
MAIMSISDHYSRTKARSSGPVMGCFIGTYQNGVWEAVAAFGVPAVPSGGDFVIDRVYLHEHIAEHDPMAAREHFVSPNGVFPEYDIIGWYRTGGSTPIAGDMESYEIVKSAAYDVSTEAITVLLDPNAAEDPELFPFSAHEVQDGAFTPIGFRVESDEAEVACVSSLASMKPRNKPAAVQMEAHIGDLKSAITILNKNIGTIVQYLQDVKNGAAVAHPELMRKIRALCNRLPEQRKDRLQGPLLSDYNDVLLAAHLAAMTKCCHEASDLASKFSVFQDNRERSSIMTMASSAMGM